MSEPIDPRYQAYARNQRYAQPLKSYVSELRGEDELAFRDWVAKNKIPFDPEDDMSDYDMRGYWRDVAKGGADLRQTNAVDGLLHFPDTYKTPYHQSFSDESIYALPGAPSWIDDHRLVDERGNVVFDERASSRRRP